jgi:hypothetical protein
MTLVEIMVATGLGSLVTLVLCSLTLYSARNFSSMVNYTDLNKDSRKVLDLVSKEIRQSRGLLERTPTSLTFKLNDGQLSYTYEPETLTLTENKKGNIKVVLDNCVFWTNEIFQRIPKEGNFDFTPTEDPKVCKMVQIRWTCTLGESTGRTNSDSIESMKVVIRKKPD